MALLAKVKLALRINNSAYDADEILPLIEEAKADLILCGVTELKAKNENDELIARAITTYCKANFGLNNPDAERLQKSYEMIRNHLTMSAEYNEVSI